jgi:hypothetical protein
MNYELRHKAIVIPLINGKYVVVQDRRHKEVTFIGGGCGPGKTIQNCAVRELAEETRNAIKMNIKNLPREPTFTFDSTERFGKEIANNTIAQARGAKPVKMRYHVFVVPMKGVSFENVHGRYHAPRSTPLTNAQLETNNIFLMNRNKLVSSKMWNFMRRRLIPLLLPNRHITPGNRSRPQTARPSNKYIPPGVRASRPKTPPRSGRW